MKKKMNNKGFSLVELIVVVAIMAILIGILAPQYLRYVEKSRLQKDNTAIAEIANAIKIASADEAVNAEIGTAGITITASASGDNQQLSMTVAGAPNLTKELKATIGDSFTTSSTSYKNPASGKELALEIKVNGDGVVTVNALNWIKAPKETPASNPL